MSTVRKTPSSSPNVKNARDTKSMLVVRNATTGRFTVGGVDERKLVNQHVGVSAKAAPNKPKHLTASQIRELTKQMKVA